MAIKEIKDYLKTITGKLDFRKKTVIIQWNESEEKRFAIACD